MKYFSLLAAVAIGSLAAAQAQAASSQSPFTLGYAPPQAQSWQGFYLGFNGGGVWGHDDISQSTTGGASTGFNPNMSTEGGAVGVQGGYNVNFGSVVVGADADWDYSGANGGYRLISDGNGQDEKFQWISTARLRLGLPLGNWLPFVTGGAAFSDIKDSYIGTGVSGDMSSVRTGWTVGGGLEYAMPENFTFRLDYRYYDFGSYTDTPSGVFPGFRYKQEPTLNSVTAGISYNFR